MSGALLLPIYILLFLAMIWFLMIRPQQRRRWELQNLIDRLAPGDDVVTVSGLYGTVTEIEEGDTILVSITGEQFGFDRRPASPADSDPEVFEAELVED